MPAPRLRQGLLLSISLGLASALSAASQFVWTGAVDSRLSSPANWSGEVPVSGAANKAGSFLIVNGEDRPLVYDESLGSTAFECEDFKIGNAKQPGGSLVVTGGELSVSSRWAPMVGHNNNRTSTLNISGGKLVFTSPQSARFEERNFRIGNWRGRNTRGVVNVTGGVLVFDTPGNISQGGLTIANDEASGELNLSGGMVVVSSIYGTSFQPGGGAGVGIITFGFGDGVFMQTDSRQLLFGEGAGAAASHINFLKGSRGQLSFAGAKAEDYAMWVRAGRIRLNGQPTTPDKFVYSDLDGQGVYRLAPSP